MSANPPYPKRLIEVDLPIKRISAHARREKSIRHGHISTLHIWWARRPLAACRAVILAALWPDPADPLCPPRFLGEARKALESVRDTAVNVPPRDYGDPKNLRAGLLDFIAEFANWGNATNRDYLAFARNMVQVAHEALGGAPGTRPLVVDPFAGGGAIPLEALRVGADAFASDLNPVAVLLNKVVLEYIPRYGQRLADDVRKWGDRLQDQAERELDRFYPPGRNGERPIAYLWARTIVSEAPEGGDVPVEVPLLRSMWLAKSSSSDRALRWIRDKDGRVRTEVREVTYADGETRQVRRPLLEIFAPAKAGEVEPGTVARGSATCPVTGFTTPVASVRRQLKARKGGAADARLLAVRQTNLASYDRTYREPTDEDIAADKHAKELLAEYIKKHNGHLSLLPDEPTSQGGGSGAGRAFSQRHYGMNAFADLFTPRQALALSTFVKLIHQAGEKIRQQDDAGLTMAVQVCLALALSRLSDFCSSLCTLNATGNRGVFHTFARQALPIVWDFMETNPLNRVGANWLGSVDALEATIRAEAALEISGQSQAASATDHPLPSDIAGALFTDPPYYDAVPYSDLSDYFYVWLRRSLPTDIQGSGFDQVLTPKVAECIVDEVKGKDRAFFERTMGQAMAEARRVLGPAGIGIVVFAHKSTGGWEAQLQAMVDAGWIVTGSWPIDTERPGRLRAMASAALTSSVHLVCRPREDPDGSLRTDDVGEWRDVLQELPSRIHAWLPRLAEEGVVGADAIFACLGPALEVFSRYARVEKASGDAVTLREYLVEVWAAVSKEALSLVFHEADTSGLEPDARLTAMWLWTLSTSSAGSNGEGQTSDEGEEDAGDEEDEDSAARPAKAVGFSLEFDAARKIAQGLGAHLEDLRSVVEVKGKMARLLPVAERARYLLDKDSGRAVAVPRPPKRSTTGLLKGMEDVAAPAPTSGEDIGPPEPGATALERVHQAMLLFGTGRAEALKRFLVEQGAGHDPRFWKLAQSLSALYPNGSDEKRWVDGVLARKKGLGF